MSALCFKDEQKWMCLPIQGFLSDCYPNSVVTHKVLNSMTNLVQVFQIAVSTTYGITEFKENLLALYTKAGVKGIQVAFLITDNQIINEKFLVFINDFLSTGYIADLCTPVRDDISHAVFLSLLCQAPCRTYKYLDVHNVVERFWNSLMVCIAGGQRQFLQCSEE